MNESQILKLRGKKRILDPWVPFGVAHDCEPTAGGTWQTSTVFLTGKECPFRCLMCDLWQYTLDGSTPKGAIAKQLELALNEIEHRDCIKLYNASNFFDPKAVPADDLQEITALLRDFKCVVVENHPKLISDRAFEFADQLSGRLQIAMGLETSDPQLLATLNKKMTLDDFANACRLCADHDVGVRTFVIHQLPGVEPDQATQQSLDAVQYSLDCGARYCSLIPLRSGNGAIDLMLEQGKCQLPSRSSFLQAAYECLAAMKSEDMFLLVDLWDLETMPSNSAEKCLHCFAQSKEAWEYSNGHQLLPDIGICSYCGDSKFSIRA